MKLKYYLFFVCVATFLSGCSSIHIHSKNGNVDVRQGIGIVNISIPENETPYLIDAKGLGITKIGSGFNIGYIQQKVAGLDDSCRVVFWIEDTAQLKGVIELLKNIGDICVLNLTKKEK